MSQEGHALHHPHFSQPARDQGQGSGCDHGQGYAKWGTGPWPQAHRGSKIIES